MLSPYVSSKGQGPNGRAHRAEELLLQHRATTELHKGHTEDVGEEQQQHQGEESEGPEPPDIMGSHVRRCKRHTHTDIYIYKVCIYIYIKYVYI